MKVKISLNVKIVKNIEGFTQESPIKYNTYDTLSILESIFVSLICT